MQNNMLATRKQFRQQQIKQGREVVEGMKQEQYNKYLQDEAASNFGALSKGALKQRKKSITRTIKTSSRASIIKRYKKR